MFRFFYRALFPVAFLGFVPGLLWKLKHRPGYKATYCERFGRFAPEREEELSRFAGAVWLHAVSVGETMIALSLLAEYRRADPSRKFVLSTTTTTAQQLARDKAPGDVAVIYCPIDFTRAVRRVFDLVKPAMLVIFETEIWPNLIWEARDRGIPCALVNARMSDHSARGYRRFRVFFGPLLANFARILTQSEADTARYASVSAADNVETAGNLKFDQKVPADLPAAHYEVYFGAAPCTVLIAASTHPGEEAFIAKSFLVLKKEFPDLKLVIAPRHAERGNEVASELEKQGISYAQRSRCAEADGVDCLLADTTGELLKLMNSADVVIMGKSLAGQNEGHNLIEPALLGKVTVTGSVLTNFRQLLKLLADADAVVTVAPEDDLAAKLRPLLADPVLRKNYGARARAAVEANSGAVLRAVNVLKGLLK